MSRRTVLAVLSLMTLGRAFPGSLPAATYYVDQGHPQASDHNAGTEASPWGTINHAATVLRAGDTVLVKEGTYNVGASSGWAAPAVAPAHRGTKENPITFKACPGHEVTITTSGGQAAIGSGRDYVVWDGFIVDMTLSLRLAGGSMGRRCPGHKDLEQYRHLKSPIDCGLPKQETRANLCACLHGLQRLRRSARLRLWRIHVGSSTFFPWPDAVQRF